MKKTNFEKLKQTIIDYEDSPKSAKDEADDKISDAWSHVYEVFATKCSQDEELNRAFDELKKIDEILSFDIKKYFVGYSHTVNAFDIEGSEDIYVFKQEKLDQARELSDNWDTVKSDILAKIEKVKASKFPFGKESKIRKLEKELHAKERIVNHYRYCMEKQKEKEYYLSRIDEVEAIRALYKELLKKYAEQAIQESLDQYPMIVCQEHRSFISCSGFKSYDMSDLNSTCNDLRKRLLDEIAADSENVLQ